MEILYVGQLNFGSTCAQRKNCLIRLNHKVITINSYSKLNYTLIGKLFYKLKIPLDFNLINIKIIMKILFSNYNLVWIDKGLTIFPFVLKILKTLHPSSKIIAYSPDDMLNKLNQSYYYTRGIKLYDYHVTTKSFNVNELLNIGAKKVIYTLKGFDPETHKKIQLTDKDIDILSCDVGHIGQYEKERFNSMLFLAENNIKVTIRGPGWNKYINYHPNLKVLPGFFMDSLYSKILNATKINLCFLRKENRDLHTARSIEIPACGGFMLAERTSEHSFLFKENEEAVYFDNKQDLLEKVKYYLDIQNEFERKRIAENGYKRCIQSDYSIDNRLSNIIHEILTN